MGNYMDPLNGDNTLKYDDLGNGEDATFEVSNLTRALHQNRIFKPNEIAWYDYFSRYGYIDPYDTDQVLKEFLFFTKPDLYIFNGNNYNNCTLNSSIKNIPFFKEAATRHKDALLQLQLGIKDHHGVRNPFMALLTNAVTSKLDLPAIQSETNQSTPNVYGVTIDYRSQSFKSDNAFDFTLSFSDTAYLEIYTMVKAYDEYMRMQKMGEISLTNSKDGTYRERYKKYVLAHILPEQFSVYKFLIGSDGETILYYAKATGVYFTDVPRSDFGDPGDQGFKYSVGFHANFVEDNNPLILTEFNHITKAAKTSTPLDVFNGAGVNNSWARFPYIALASASNGDKRVMRRGTSTDYRLKWTQSATADIDYNYSGSNAAYYDSTNRNGRYGSGGDSSAGNSVYINNKNYYSAGLRVNSSGYAGSLMVNTENRNERLFTR